MLSRIKKFASFLVILILISLLYSSNGIRAEAAQPIDFTHSINATYEVKDTKSSIVEYIFTTTNKIANNYLQTFSLKLPFEPRNIKTDYSPTAIKVLPPKKIGPNELYAIDIELLNSVYGLNKSFKWKFTFEVNNLVYAHGSQNAIVIPNFNNEPNIVKTDVNVKIPDTIGEIKYIYGNASSSKHEGNTFLSYSSDNNKSSNFIVLTGNDQEYIFETGNINNDLLIPLPYYNAYQDIVYTKFPEKKINVSDKQNKGFINIKNGEIINAIIKTKHAHDERYAKEFDEITNNGWVNKLTQALKKDGIDNTELSKSIFDMLIREFTLTDYLTTSNTYVDITSEKKKLIPSELNKLFREILTSFGIENRGIYGYVFPIQPFIRDNFVAEQHVWSEYWDGKKWIVVDPTWYVASKGTDYFDKNSYHHIKFGSYHDIKELKSFFDSSSVIKLIPQTSLSNISRKEDLVLSALSDASINKEYRVFLINNSNIPLKINFLTTTVDKDKVKLKEPNLKIDNTIYPGGQLNVNIPLDYSLNIKNIAADLKLEVDYSTLSGESSSKNYIHKINIRTNLSSYLIQFILGFVLLVITLPVFIFGVYKLTFRRK
jgi:hypothetical protein